MANEATQTAAAENEIGPETSEFEKAIKSMSADQLNQVASIAAAETARRDDPLARLGSMSDAEARRVIDEKFGFMPF